MNITRREKRFIIAGILIALVVLAFNGYTYYREQRDRVSKYIEMRQQILERQMRYLSQKDRILKASEEVRKGIARFDLMFLGGDKPPVAAAKLQELIGGITSGLSIQVKTQRALSAVDMGYYFAVPVEIGLVTDTKGLKELLVRLKRHPKLILVSDLKVRVVNIKSPERINVTMVVTGFMKKTVTQEIKDRTNA